MSENDKSPKTADMAEREMIVLGGNAFVLESLA